MAVNITIEDSAGTLRDITPGWSVTEHATPIAPGDTSGATGNVSFTAGRGVDSEFIINSPITFTHDDLGDTLGMITSAATTGATEDTDVDVRVGVDSILNLLNVDKNADLLGEGMYLMGWGSN